MRAFETWVALDDLDFTLRFPRDFAFGVHGRRSQLAAPGGDEAAWTGLQVTADSLEDFIEKASARLPPVRAACASCRAFNACGGGDLPHRLGGESFDDPSAYCSALLGLHDVVVATSVAALTEGVHDGWTE